MAIGWLAGEKAYTKDNVPLDVFSSLAKLLVDPWQPVATAGRHACPFCRFTGGPAKLDFGDHAISCGTNNVFVPGDDCVYVAPSMILHYVDAHEYCPPEVFQKAVLACPAVRSVAYMKAMRARGLR